jgi:hypothetical protein
MKKSKKSPEKGTRAWKIAQLRQEIQSAREDSSLQAGERYELICDLRADLARLMDPTPEEYRY